MRQTKSIVLLMAAVTVGWTAIGCDDEFADAPSAEASSSSADKPPGLHQGGVGPVEGTELPPGHPPIAPQQAQTGTAAGANPAPPIERLAPSEYGEAGPLRWEAPGDWRAREPSSSMRYAEYVVGHGENLSAELTIFYFGEDMGGAVEGNLKRWESQLRDGPAPQRDQIEVQGMTVHLFDGAGTYEADLPGLSDGPQEDQRLLGAIAESSRGLFFFRLLGDRELIDEQEEPFRAFLESLREE